MVKLKRIALQASYNVGTYIIRIRLKCRILLLEDILSLSKVMAYNCQFISPVHSFWAAVLWNYIFIQETCTLTLFTNWFGHVIDHLVEKISSSILLLMNNFVNLFLYFFKPFYSDSWYSRQEYHGRWLSYEEVRLDLTFTIRISRGQLPRSPEDLFQYNQWKSRAIMHDFI